MKSDFINHLKKYALKIREPENLFSGLKLPRNFVPPDNILVFHHNYIAATPNAHGRCTIVFPFSEMTYFVDRKRIDLKPGNVLMIPPHSLRYLHPDSAGYGRLFITFEIPRDNLPETVVGVLTRETEKILSAFLRSYAYGASGECALELFLFLRTVSESKLPGVESEVIPGCAAKALKFIGEHLSEPIGNKDIANASGISESRLRAVFRSATGMGPGVYLARQKLDAAKRKLLTTDLRISEIASSCGYANIYVFSAFFRRHTGISPLAFRRGKTNTR